MNLFHELKTLTLRFCKQISEKVCVTKVSLVEDNLLRLWSFNKQKLKFNNF